MSSPLRWLTDLGRMRLPVAALAFALASSLPLGAQTLAYSNWSNATDRLPSVGYEANSIAELGDYISLAPATSRELSSFTVGMMSWTLAANGAPYDLGITLNVYAVDLSGPAAAVGSLLTTKTSTFTVPPDTHPTNNGTRFNLDFDFSATPVTLPDDIIWTIAFDHELPGAQSLNLAVYALGPTVGTNPEPGVVFVRPDAGVLAPQSGWGSYSPAGQITTISVVPEPSTVGMLGVGVVLAGVALRRRRWQG